MTFDPTTLAGKRLWLRAKDNAGANGSAITTWADQSGTAHDGTAAGTSPTVVTAATPLGGKAVQFGGAGNFALGAAMADTVFGYSASSTFGEAQWVVTNVGDGNASTDWASATGVPQWVRSSSALDGAVAATSYTLTGAASGINDSPKNWTFEGSADATTWTTLDTRTGIVFSGSTPQTFNFTNTIAYRHYRLNVTLTNASSLVRLAGFTLSPAPASSVPASEIWLVVKAESTDNNALMQWNDGAYTAGGDWYPFSTGNLYSSFGTNTHADVAIAAGSVQSWRIYRVVNDGTNLTQYLDGVQKSTSTIASHGGISWGSNALLGKHAPGGPANINFFTGKMAEVLVRSQVSTAQEVSDITAYLTAEHFVAPVPVGPTAQMAFAWGGVQYAKGDVLPVFRVSQMRHLRQRGYVDSGTTLVVGKPFLDNGVLLAAGAAMPAGLTDAQLRRLIASRHLV